MPLLPFTHYRILTDAGWTFLFGLAGSCAVVVSHYAPEDVSDPVPCGTLEEARRGAVGEATAARRHDGEWDVRVLTCEMWWKLEKRHAGQTVH